MGSVECLGMSGPNIQNSEGTTVMFSGSRIVKVTCWTKSV